jgi:uncharacterized protein YceK
MRALLVTMVAALAATGCGTLAKQSADGTAATPAKSATAAESNDREGQWFGPSWGEDSGPPLKCDRIHGGLQ